MRVGFIVAAVGLTLSGCASLSEDDCKTGDWQGIGVVDGRAGFTSDKLNEHTKACSKYGISPDVNAYMAGRTLGLQSYCTPISGFEQGREDKSYRGVCPIASEEGFKVGYSLGNQIYVANEAADDAQDEVRNIQYRIDELEEEARGKNCKSSEDKKACRKQAEAARMDAYLARAELLLAQNRLSTLERQRDRVMRSVTNQLMDLEPSYNPS
ncbi:hypothetical protein GCM10007094_37670 [Pseudovibrio japonicus]|uniref:DUF2799 domain-containing protein n=1 Tax=Pseudovibrio japonicus TaxID=366534 RepID=A0ABQ3EQC2_9HYPH|nr:DUF2799 domain-containing protein [Pseudovibrio japonicus]GHB44796.1 hypothetical protein GCM10007094_37670 [Pseudovibrio japonicus]